MRAVTGHGKRWVGDRWVDDIMPLLMDGDPLGVEGFATHKGVAGAGTGGHEPFQKEDGAIKVLIQPAIKVLIQP